MQTSPPRRRRSVARTLTGAVALTAAVGLTATAAPAVADTATASDGATATVADIVASGNSIHIDGTGWTHPTNGTGSTIGVKLGDALTTEPASGAVINPATGESADSLDLWAAIEAEDDGDFSADITFPTPENTNPALPTAWAVGTTHTLRLLSGSMESGDTPRSVLLTFTVGEGLVATATTATTGAVTVALSGGDFPAGEVLSVKQGSTSRQWTIRSGRTSTTADTYTVPDSGAVSVSVVLPAGAAPAGDVTLTITGDQGSRQDVTVQAPPSVAFDNGTSLGASGTLTLGNLVAGATVSSVKLGDTTLASNLTAGTDGNATAAYAIPADIAPITYSLVVTQSAPTAEVYTLSQAVYPDETTKGANRFQLTSTTADQGFYQGFYQSAYSPKEDALYVTASDRGTGNGGYIYKLDPDTLAIEASYNTVDHDEFTKTGAFGIGVDDVHGNVWVSNTGSASVAVYKESDLSLVKQFPANTITHPRDVVYDPETDRVFVSSASEGSSATATGYISVFDADTLEKVQDVETGTRDVFNPVSLALDDGTVYSPSLGSDKVVALDTKTLGWKYLTIDGVDVGGRGASGIAYDESTNRLFIASQNSNEVVIADATSGATIAEAPTGRGALNVQIDPVHELVYVTNFGGTSVTVLDIDGNKVASLPIATANHVSVDGLGNAYVVDKATPTNKVWKITPRLETVGGVDVLDPTAAGVTGDPATTPLSVSVVDGKAIHISGTNFLTQDGTSGSTIAVKPASVQGSPTIATIEADADGSWSADVPFPSDWVVGESQHLRLLTGSLKAGDTIRSIAIKVDVDPDAAAIKKQITKVTKQVKADKAVVAKVTKQLAKAKKATKHGTKQQKAAAKKKVKNLTKKLAAAKKKLAKDQAKLAELKKQLKG